MSNSEYVIKCPDSLTIAAVADFQGELKTALETQNEIILSGSDVDVADTAGLQLLCAFFMDATAHDINIRWDNASQPLRDSAEQIGVCEIIHLDEPNVH